MVLLFNTRSTYICIVGWTHYEMYKKQLSILSMTNMYEDFH